jgi:hypothetical protein
MKDLFRSAIATIACTYFCIAATPAPSPSASAPAADPAVTKVARQQFVAWQAGSLNDALYAPEVVPKLTPEKVAEVSRALAALGPLVATDYVAPFSAADIPPGAHGYIYNMHCTGGSIYLWLILDPRGKIATIYFKNKLDVETIERPEGGGVSSPPR